jgi:transcriptional regulator with XRE-family HTH domain
MAQLHTVKEKIRRRQQMPAFGELLRRLRGSRPQRAVAADLEMPVTTLSTLENQEAVPRGPVLRKLASYYGVSMTYFYQQTVSEMRPTNSAREWLDILRGKPAVKDVIATHAPPEYPDEIKKQFAEKIREKKRDAGTSHR